MWKWVDSFLRQLADKDSEEYAKSNALAKALKIHSRKDKAMDCMWSGTSGRIDTNSKRVWLIHYFERVGEKEVAETIRKWTVS